MENKYTTEKAGFNLVSVLEDGKSIALTETLDQANRIINALVLYDTLKREFASFVERKPEPEDETDYVEYVGINSSWIVKLGYNKSTKRLTVFKKDSSISDIVKMVYSGVPESELIELLHPNVNFNGSAGKAYNELIRGKYKLEITGRTGSLTR